MVEYIKKSNHYNITIIVFTNLVSTDPTSRGPIGESTNDQVTRPYQQSN